MLKRAFTRLATAFRHAGGFAASRESAALLRRLDAIGAGLDALRADTHELRRQHKDLRAVLARVEAAQREGATRGDVRDVGRSVQRTQELHRKQIDAVRRDSRRERHHLERVEAHVQSLLRRAHLDVGALPFPERLMARRFGAFSQNGEDGLVLALLEEMGPGDRRFVEIGCSDHGWNTGFLAEECGWSGLMADGNAESVAATRLRFREAAVRAVTAFVTPDGIDAFLQEHGFAGEFDLLSIDVDGSDYWLWRGVTVAAPRLVIIEYNSSFGGGRAVVTPFAAGREWDATAHDHRYFGASLKAIERLGAEKGYRLVAIEPDSANAFLLRDGVAPGVPAARAEVLFRPQRKFLKTELARETDVFRSLAQQQLPLIDLDA